METERPKMFTEKTIYRTQKLPEAENDLFSRSTSSQLNRPKLGESRGSNRLRGSDSFLNKSSARGHRSNSAKPIAKNADEDLDWQSLGAKIEDWFGYAKTPDQKVVYKFLNNLQSEEDNMSVYSERSSSAVPIPHDRTQSLEDILDNLKKYRHKFNKSPSKSAKPMKPNGNLPNLKAESSNNLDGMFESSTWRVMRHLKSADIRSKYPLPKANPDYHFRNATIFQVAGRAPKSTFLLHPDWV